MQIVDTNPAVAVDPAEYTRLLGYPPGQVLSGRACELATAAAGWYAGHGHPWVYTREAASLDWDGDLVRIEGSPFSGAGLRVTLREAEAHAVVLVAAGAGPELEEESARLWREEKPDEYFFLEVYGSAVVEHLITAAGAQLCAWAETADMAALPHYSPGYAEWDVAEQPRLLELMRGLPSRLEALESGALRPKKSQLAVVGLTRKTAHLRRRTDLVPCANCGFRGCQYRRMPYRRDASPPAYTVNLKALRRWAAERLFLEHRADGGIDARFRYEGTTCSNMGRPLAFDYVVTLGCREEGYRVREQRCLPAPGDTGYPCMCAYQQNAQALMQSIAEEKPMAGRPLADVLSWQRPALAAGCYCEAGSRDHKWGLVLETIHFALNSEPK